MASPASAAETHRAYSVRSRRRPRKEPEAHVSHGRAPDACSRSPWAARDLEGRVRGVPRYLFYYSDRGYLVSLGPGDAVGRAAGARVRGAAARALYRSAFLYYQRGRRDRRLTGADWAMSRALGRLGFA